MRSLSRILVLIRGGGDLASGVAHRLHRAGFRIVITELPVPMVVRRGVALAQSVFTGEVEIEGVKGRLIKSTDQITRLLESSVIPVVVDPEGKLLETLSPTVLVDARMAKRNVGSLKDQAPVVLGLGPGFVAGRDVDGVVETKRGHRLGRLLLEGSALPNTGQPAPVLGVTEERIIRAPVSGLFKPCSEIGDRVEGGELLARVDGVEVLARTTGVVRGLLYPGLQVKKGQKLGDLDPRGRVEDCYLISDRARAVAGGVLEGILYLLRKRGL